ncbi:hypothetical protein [Porphyromonas pogonae]
MKRCIVQYILPLFVALLCSCERAEKINTLGETEYYFDEKLSSLSTGDDGVLWIGGETGSLWRVKDDERRVFEVGEDRIYKVLSRNTDSLTTICWVGVRNSGLQRWVMQDDRMHRQKVYLIPVKKEKYSTYDIAMLGDHLYAATSQGLYRMPVGGNAVADSLQLVYPHDQDLWRGSKNYFIVNNLCTYRDSLLLAATEQGVISVSKDTGRVELSHKGRAINHVSVYGDTIFALSDNMLYLDTPAGKSIREVRLPLSPKLYYQSQGIHYIVGTDNMLLSNDLVDFVMIPLRRKTPAGCRNIMLPDPRHDFTLMLTENALWRVPHHLGIFNGSTSVKAACAGSNETYYLTTHNELYRKEDKAAEASLIYTFPKEEQIVRMDLVGHTIYYYNARQELKMINVSGSKLKNMLMHRAATMYQSKDKITAMGVKQTGDKVRVYLGVQDGLVVADGINIPDTVRFFENKYVTAFYSARHSDLVYLSTLNDGAYYVCPPDSVFKPIGGSERNTFIRDIIATEAHLSTLITLTNHHIITQNPNDTVPVRGYNKLLYVNDSLFYALPEYGLRKFRIKDGHMSDEGLFYTDIRFSPAASLVHGGHLYLGSNLGVLTLKIDHENQPSWENFGAGDIFSPRYAAGVAIVIVILILILAVVAYLYRKRKSRMLITRRIETLKSRAEELNSFYALSDDAGRSSIMKLRQEISEIAPDKRKRRETNMLIARLTNEIIKLNREATLSLSQKLKKQMECIARAEAYESSHLWEQSVQAESSGDVERIRQQVSRNGLWLEQLKTLGSDLSVRIEELTGCLEHVTFNNALVRRFTVLRDDIARKPLADLMAEYKVVAAEYDNLYSDYTLTLILDYMHSLEEALHARIESDYAVRVLITRLGELASWTSHEQRIPLLRELDLIEKQIQFLQTKDRIADSLVEYQNLRNMLIKENEGLVNKKFDKELEDMIAVRAKSIVKQVEQLTVAMYELITVTDAMILDEVLRFSNFYHQQAKVLAILVANPKVKRSLIPGVLGIYGNLNPVISRLVNNKIKTNEKVLKEYLRDRGKYSAFVYYVLHIAD